MLFFSRPLSMVVFALPFTCIIFFGFGSADPTEDLKTMVKASSSLNPECSRAMPPTTLIFSSWNRNVTLAAMELMRTRMTSIGMKNAEDSCLIIGLNIGLEKICDSSQQFLLNNKKLFVVLDSMELKNCSDLNLNSNIFAIQITNGRVKIKEYYKTTHGTIENLVIDIDKKSEHFMPNKTIWERRNNFHGMRIRARLKHCLPWIQTYDVGEGPKGVLVDVMEDLKSRFNFTVEYSFSSLADHWNKDVELVKNGSEDVGWSCYSTNMERYKNIELGLPFHYNSATKIRYCLPDDPVSWEIILKPLKPTSWLRLVFYLLGMTIALAATRIILYGWHGIHLEDSLGITLVTILSKRVRVVPIHLSGKVLLLTSLFIGFVFITMYKTMLSAMLAIEIVKPPVERLEDLLGTSMKLYVLRGSANAAQFTDAQGDSTFGKLYKGAGTQGTTKGTYKLCSNSYCF